MERDDKVKNGIERLVSYLRFKRSLLQPSSENQLPTQVEPRTPSRLPPITEAVGHISPVCGLPASEQKPCSRYPTKCLKKSSLFYDWLVLNREKKSPKCRNNKQKNSRNSPSPRDSYEQDITHFLNENKSFLELYILENISVEEIEEWLCKKYNPTGETESALKTSLSDGTGQNSHKDIFMNLIKTLNEDTSELSVVTEIARLVSSSLDADSYKIYKLFQDHNNFVQYFVEESENASRHLVRADIDDVKLVLEVAKTGKSLKVAVESNTDSSHEGHSSKTDNKKYPMKYIIFHPLFSSSGKPSYVFEITRKKEFTDLEVEQSANYLVWGSMLIYYCNLYLDKNRERNMSDFLLEVVRAVFEEMVSLDQLIKRILEFAQRLVNADRASLFLVDYRNSELVSTVFDLKFEPGQNRDVEKKEIRMPINRGIAGHVALSGETMNIPDAYSDYRFNREVDEATGYKTISILCMPIKVQGKVIGVVQMVNKRTEDNFDHEDETAFEIFSSFFGLALHHARLYDRIMRKEQKYRVALEVLSYHNTCRENEVTAMLSDNNDIALNLNDYYLDPYIFNEFEKCKAVIKMFNNLFDLSKFDVTTVTRFVLTVKKNYRTVPYHNFDHGWSVAHAMYVILQNDNRRRYSYKMRLALFIACLCHDLDHRGYTNKYMSETASPLAAMYTTSTLEHHHFNITVTILQQDGHNIFAHMSSDEYKDILSYIRHCILATDLAAFFPNLSKMKELYNATAAGQGFNWTLPAHRDLAMAISMTAADLSASAKPWEVQIKTVRVIFEEFYDQGDKEREAGRTPIPMMDRNQPDEQPASQVGFLSQICIPCYASLHRILPKTKPMYVMAMKNLANWKSKAHKIDQKRKTGIIDNKDLNLEEEFFCEIEIPENNVIDSELESDSFSMETVTTDDELAVEVESEDVAQVGGKAVELLEREQITSVWQVIKKSPTSWVEEEEESDEKAGSSIWKNIDGIDEEGLVVGSKKVRKNNSDKSDEKQHME